MTKWKGKDLESLTKRELLESLKYLVNEVSRLSPLFGLPDYMDKFLDYKKIRQRLLGKLE